MTVSSHRLGLLLAILLSVAPALALAKAADGDSAVAATPVFDRAEATSPQAPGAAEDRPELAAWLEPSADLQATVEVGKSRVVVLPNAYDNLIVADPKIVDVLPITGHSFALEGKNVGETVVMAYGRRRTRLANIAVVVTPDVEGLKTKLREILPDEPDVRVVAVNHSLVISGTVTSPVGVRHVMDLASAFGADKVINMLSVRGTQQVMLSVRFVEMSRSAAKDLNVSISGVSNNQKTSVFTGSASASGIVPAATSFGSAVAQLNHNFSIELDAMETKGLARTLAEPTLIATSGETASFLAGGEYPIPVAQLANVTGAVAAPTIEYKQFGVSLAFTPTILEDGMISLIIRPEVSSIDPTVSINVGGISIPGLKVRRGMTTLELHEGESFAMAGLLMDDYAAQVSQLPFLGEVPILGALFRSNGYQRKETELVIVITPHLVSAHRGELATPADHFVPPSDYDLFLRGRTETPGKVKQEDADDANRHEPR